MDVRIKRLDYVESVREKVYERMISERKRIAAQFPKDAVPKFWGQWKRSCARSAQPLTVVCRRSKAKPTPRRRESTAGPTIKNPEFYVFLRTLESYKEKTNPNSVLILTTDSDFYQYIKNAKPGQVQVPSAK